MAINNEATFYINVVAKNLKNIGQQVNQSINQGVGSAAKNKGALNTQGVIIGSAIGNAISSGIGAALRGIDTVVGTLVSGITRTVMPGIVAQSSQIGLIWRTKVANAMLKGIRILNIMRDLLSKITPAMIALGAAFTYIGGKAVSRWASFNEELNKTQVLFREAGHMADKFVNTISKSYGLARINTLKLVGDIQNTLMPFVSNKTAADMGTGKRTAAARQSIPIAERVMDIASLRDLDIGEVATLMTSAIIRGGRAAQSLGAAMSAVEVEQLALLRSGKARVGQLTLEEKQHARIELIMQRTADAEGDMMRTAGSIANAWRGFKGTISETMTILGSILDVIDIGGILLNIAALIKIINQLLGVMGVQAQFIAKLFRTINDTVNIVLTGIMFLVSKLGGLLGGLGSKLSESLNKLGKGSAIEYFKKNYSEMADEIRRLKDEQMGDPNIDNSAQIAFYESIARSYANFVDLLGGEIDIVDPFEDMKDNAEEVEKITAAIHNNLLKIGEDIQEALIESEIDINKFIKAPDLQSTSGPTNNSMDTMVSVAVEQKRILSDMLIEMRKGIYA